MSGMTTSVLRALGQREGCYCNFCAEWIASNKPVPSNFLRCKSGPYDVRCLANGNPDSENPLINVARNDISRAGFGDLALYCSPERDPIFPVSVVLVAELGGYERKGVFEYLRLPWEIRQNIMQKVLEDLPINRHKEDEVAHVQIKTSDMIYHQNTLGLFRLGIDHHRNCGRVSRTDVIEKSKIWYYLRWLNKLTHVCSGMAHDLGQAFWKTAILDAHFSTIPRLVQERPAIFKYLQNVCFEFTLTIGGPEAEKNEAYYKAFDRIAALENLAFKKLSVVLEVRGLYPGSLNQGDQNLDGLGAFRKIKVMNTFDLTIVWNLSYSGALLGYRYTREAQKEETEYKAMIRDTMLPDTLRKQVLEMPLTEEQAYLEARQLALA